jgi:hypothetical protein
MDVNTDDQRRICQFSVLTAKQNALENELQSIQVVVHLKIGQAQ